MLLTVPIAEWLEGHAGEKRVAGSIPGLGINYHFGIFEYGNVVHISAKTIQMKSSMTFIQSNGCTGIDLILKQIWRRFK